MRSALRTHTRIRRVQENGLEGKGGRTASRKDNAEGAADNNPHANPQERGLGPRGDARAAAGERGVECPQRVADIAMIARRRSVGGCGGKSVRGVIVENQDGVAVWIVSPGMSPVERTPDHDGGKDGGKAPLKQPTIRCPQPHPLRL